MEDLKKMLNKIISEEVQKLVTESTDNENNDESYDDMIDRLDGMSEMVEEDGEGNEQSCNECGGELNEGVCLECEDKSKMNENKKKVLRLNETEMKNLIAKIIEESEMTIPSVTKTSQSQSKKDSEENLKNVNKKIKDNGMSSEDEKKNKKVVARRNTEEQDQEVEEQRGGGLEDLNYDIEPSDLFKERQVKAIKGDSTMGNSPEYTNSVKTDLGDKIIKKVKRKKENLKNAPMYNKEPQPVKIVKESINDPIEEMKRMKEIFKYNKKTQ